MFWEELLLQGCDGSQFMILACKGGLICADISSVLGEGIEFDSILNTILRYLHTSNVTSTKITKSR